MLSTVVLHDLDEIPPDLASRCSYPEQPKWFLTTDWYRCLYRTSLEGELRPRVFLTRDDANRPLGALFCGVHGGALRSLTNFYSLAYGPCVFDDGPDERPILDALARSIAAERPRFPTLDFQLLDLDSPRTAAFEASLRAHGFAPTRYFQYENWFVRTGGASFEEYFAARPSKLRNTIKRKEKKLHKAARVDIRIVTDDGPGLDAAVRDYEAVYNRSWKKPEPYPEFTPGLASTCARLGILRLGVLSLDDRPVAAQLWITTGRTALIYKLAYDEEFKNLSAGSILSRDLFRHALDVDRVEELDYGVGSEGYKRDWMDSVRRLGGIRAHNLRTVSGIGQAFVERAKRLVRGRPSGVAASDSALPDAAGQGAVEDG